MADVLNILSVDDSKTIRMILRNLMGKVVTDRPINFLEAENGQEAWDLVQSGQEINLILLDWNMPIMTGDVFLAKLRAEKSYNNIRVVMVTTEGERGKVVEMAKRGVSGYIVKPFNQEIISRTLLPLIARM